LGRGGFFIIRVDDYLVKMQLAGYLKCGRGVGITCQYPGRCGLKEQVQEALDKIRPALQRDGGDVELVEVNESNGVVKVRLQGACGGCPMSQMTLKMGIEKVVKQTVPQVTSVEAVQ